VTFSKKGCACCSTKPTSIGNKFRSFEEIFDQTGDAEAHGIASLLTKYNTVACIYILSDVLHTIAKLQGSLQGKEVNLAGVPGMVESTLERLKELKEDTDTYMVQRSLYCVH
jgi:hypothetical protein